jgi:hypothetical protein
MNIPTIVSRTHLKRGARVAGLGAIAVLSLGSASGQASANVPFVAQANSLQPSALAAGAPTPVVQERVVQADVTAPVAVQTTVKKSSGGGSCGLDYIKKHESGGNYSATSKSGKYRGAYQFDQRTWESAGGSGDPAAASPQEQDARAAQLYAQRGSQPWSVCH